MDIYSSNLYIFCHQNLWHMVLQCRVCACLIISCDFNYFMQVVEYYSVIPKVSEDHVTVSHFFSFWSKFSHDLKKEWQLQQKWVAKQRASTLRRDRSKVLKKPVVAGGLVRHCVNCSKKCNPISICSLFCRNKS